MEKNRIHKPILTKSYADEVNTYSNGDGEFPAGLRILIVDDDRTCLLVLERMLRKLSYQVTKCEVARDALALLRENKNRFDIVICDIHMPDMDGFKLLEIIRQEMDLPVVMMSSDDGKGAVMKGILNGACDYLVKPVRMEAIRLIWQHVVRKRKRSISNNQMRAKEDEENGEAEAEAEAEAESSDEVATSNKKPRMIWTQELHDLFVAAINQLGPHKAVPKKILERMQAMNVSGITRANIASHLQKYRMHLQKVGGDLNDLIEQQVKAPQPAAPQLLPLQNFVDPQQQSYRFEMGTNENYPCVPTAPDRQGFHAPNFSMYRPNLLYQQNQYLASSEEYLYKNAVDDLLYDPSFSPTHYDQDASSPFMLASNFKLLSSSSSYKTL